MRWAAVAWSSHPGPVKRIAMEFVAFANQHGGLGSNASLFAQPCKSIHPLADRYESPFPARNDPSHSDALTFGAGGRRSLIEASGVEFNSTRNGCIKLLPRLISIASMFALFKLAHSLFFQVGVRSRPDSAHQLQPIELPQFMHL